MLCIHILSKLKMSLYKQQNHALEAQYQQMELVTKNKTKY